MAITFRDTQNPLTPNLPFAQVTDTGSPVLYPIHTEAPIPINFGQPLSLAGLTRRQEYNDYQVTGDIPFPAGLGHINGIKRFTVTNANNYRRMGYSVVLVEDTGGILLPKPPRPNGSGTTTNGHDHVFETVHPKQTQQLIKMGKDMTELGHKLNEALQHRMSIEEKVELGVTQRREINKSLTDLGQSAFDISSALDVHKIGHNGFNPFPTIPLSVIAIGGIALFLLTRRKSRKK
tara:strand:+ start:99 stop:800 length:702 start_codon:yes stop_codon:yes gene_type:complete